MDAERLSSNFNLVMVNLWIGLCRGDPGLPRDLRNLDYEDRGIEWKFVNQDQEVVLPDLIIASKQAHHTVLLEFKSGANTDPHQLRRYSRVTQDDLVRKASLDPRFTGNHDVALVGLAKHADRLRIGIEGGPFPFPLLSADDNGLALFHNKFQASELTYLFSRGLKVDWDRVPSAYVPLDDKSELWEVAEMVVPCVLDYMSQREPWVGLNDICEHIFRTWFAMGTPARDKVKAKVRDVLVQLPRRHFSSYLRWDKGRCSIEILENPLDLQPDRRTAAYRKLRTAARKFVDSLRSRGSRPPREFQTEFPF